MEMKMVKRGSGYSGSKDEMELIRRQMSWAEQVDLAYPLEECGFKRQINERKTLSCFGNISVNLCYWTSTTVKPQWEPSTTLWLITVGYFNRLEWVLSDGSSWVHGWSPRARQGASRGKDWADQKTDELGWSSRPCLPTGGVWVKIAD